MLDLHRLRLLVELNRRGTIAEVARALSFSPSAVSQQLAVLEREVGVDLLEKVGRRVRLTPNADMLVRHAEVVLDRLEQAEAEIAAGSGQLHGTFRVGCFTSVMLALMPTVLSQLAQDHPALTIEADDSVQRSTASALLAGEFDLVLSEQYPGDTDALNPAVHREALLDDELLVAVPASMSIHGPVLAALQEAPWVLETDKLRSGQWSRRLFAQAGYKPHVRFTSSDLLLQIELVRRGLAVTILPDLHTLTENDGVLLHSLPGRPTRRLSTSVRRGSTNHPRVIAFRKALRDSVEAIRSSS